MNKTDIKNPKREKNKPDKLIISMNYILLFVLIMAMSANQYFLNAANDGLGINYDLASIAKKISSGGSESVVLPDGGDKELNGNLSNDAIALVISKGAPEAYGSELGVSFEKVQESMNIMRQFDPYDLKPQGKRIILEGEDLKRYIDIGTRISCEYCCGAKSIIFKDGKSACGCAHSMAMRGLAAYLIKNHGSEYTNDQILRELARWKGMFFPKQMITKMATQLQAGSYTPDIAAILLDMKLPDYGEGNSSAPLPSEIQNLPGMVGGC